MNYGSTYADLAATPPEKAWHMLRALRHKPPGYAGSGDRKATFNAALEQSEQFTRAAAGVGVATRPVLLFYAVSQAGWVISSAARSRNGQDWRLGGGHGITARRLSALDVPLSKVTVQNSGHGSFTEVAETLCAASLPDETTLGDLWCLIPGAESSPLHGQGTGRLVVVEQESFDIIRGGRTRAVIANLPMHLWKAPPVLGNDAEIEAERAAVRSFLADYPTLRDAEFVWSEGEPTGLQRHDHDSLRLPVVLGAANSATIEAADIESRGYTSGGMTLAYPCVGGSDRNAHPFLVWWAVLFALSQLARYEPKAWLQRTNISTSADASPIEHLLDRAQATLPELIHRTIMEVADAGL